MANETINVPHGTNREVLHESLIRDQMARMGLYPNAVSIDGRLRRFDVEKRGNKAGWYIFHCDQSMVYGAYGNWRTGEKHTFCSKSTKEMTEGERQRLKNKQKELQKHIDAQRKREMEHARRVALYVIDRLKKKSHPYLERKGVKLHGAAGIYHSTLVIPMYRGEDLIGVQYINDANKRFIKGAQTKGAYYVIGDAQESEKLCFAEGYATASSVHEATGLACVVTFNAGNIEPVVQYWRKTLPKKPMIICADNDESQTGEKYALEAAGKHGAAVRLCPITGDFNDMHVAQGLEAVRDFILPKEVATTSNEAAIEHKESGWWSEWVYINAEGCFYHKDTHARRNVTAFNLANGQHIDEDDGTATQFVSKHSLIGIVEKAIYAPSVEEDIFEDNGLRVINSFDRRTLPKAASAYTDAGREAIDQVLRHISYICNKNDDHAKILTEWIAWQVQHMGKKILWSPIIQGAQGIGKSFFNELLEKLLGHQNVGTVSPTQVTSQFNGWATDVCVNVLSELRIAGHNRYEAVNALKPLITDSMIQINKKNVTPYQVRNSTNYICTTNFRDAVPMDSTERRWFIIFAEYDDVHDFVAKCAPDEGLSYFPALFDAIRAHPDELRLFFLTYKISDQFIAYKQAPDTIYKNAVVQNELAKDPALCEAKELIKTGGKGYCEEVVDVKSLFEALTHRMDMSFAPREKASILIKLGYTCVGKQVKVRGYPRRVWVKNISYDAETIRYLLENTGLN